MTKMNLPSKAVMCDAGDQATVELSPGNRFKFPFPGPSPHPEIYLETARRGNGPPLHSHPWATWEIVIEGEVRFRINDEDYLVREGGCIYTPPNAIHTYSVVSETAKTVGINEAGALLHSLQSQAAPLFAGPDAPPMDQVAAIASKVGVTLHGPPLSVPQT